MFPKQYIKEELSKYVLARLYTDKEGSPYEEYQAMQKERYGTVMLPLYVITEPGDSVPVAQNGFTKDSVKFHDFLLKGVGAQVSQR